MMAVKNVGLQFTYNRQKTFVERKFIRKLRTLALVFICVLLYTSVNRTAVKSGKRTDRV